MSRPALLLALLAPALASAAEVKFRLPLDGCDANPGGCQVWKPCTITAYYDQERNAGSEWACTAGCKDFNCGNFSYDQHVGTDVGVMGTINVRAVVAAADGKVIQRNDGCDDNNTSCVQCGDGFGNWVQLQHADGKKTIYGHMAKGSLQVQLNQQVKCGQILGKAASSGCSTGPHLHFEVETPGIGSDDPFGSSSCGTPLSYWQDQGPYCGLPSTAGCQQSGGTDDASFTGDETVFDGTVFAPGTPFIKTWTLENSGTNAWSSGNGYRWAFVEGDALGGPANVSLGASEKISAGGKKVWSVNLKAPAANGKYTGYWQMERAGVRFGDKVWVEIEVKSGADAAQFMGETIRDGTEIGAGVGFTKTWTLKNVGSTAWTAATGFTFKFEGGAQMGAPAKLELGSETVAVGAQKTWSVDLKAPSAPGTYTGYWRMDHSGTGFGDQVWVQIVVGGGGSSSGTDGAGFVTETIPDGSRMDRGSRFTKTWTLKNSGTTTWSSSGGYALSFDGGEPFNAPDTVQLGPSESIAPGQTKVFSVEMTAPAKGGTYTGYFRMSRNREPFGDRVWAQIEVVDAAATDLDRDGHPAKAHGGDDCDDRDKDVHPGLAEACDGKDNDCNGKVDDAEACGAKPGADAGGGGPGEESEPFQPGGCGCGAAGAPSLGGLFLLALAGLRRARRGARG